MLGFFVIFWFPGLAMLCVTRPLPLLPSYWMFALWDSLYCELWLTSTTSFSASQLKHLAARTIHKVQVTPRPGNSFQGPRQFRISIRRCPDRFPIVQKSLPLPSKNSATNWTTSLTHLPPTIQSILWDSPVSPSRQYLITTATPAPDPRAVHRRSYFYSTK